MQVGLTSSSLATGGAHSAAVSSSTVAPTQAVQQKLPATASEYPASPLITTRPQRYSVQLNDQLTTLQQADHYLGQLEQQLLDYRHSQRKGGQAQSTALMQMLDKRAALSGGAVDRQLQPLRKKSRMRMSLLRRRICRRSRVSWMLKAAAWTRSAQR